MLRGALSLSVELAVEGAATVQCQLRWPIKDRNGTILAETEDIKKWQEYTEELYKEDLHDPDNHTIVVIWVIKVFFV